MYSKTRTKLGIIYESCKLSEHLVASLAKVEQSLAIRHIAEYVYRLATAVLYILIFMNQRFLLSLLIYG